MSEIKITIDLSDDVKALLKVLSLNGSIQKAEQNEISKQAIQEESVVEVKPEKKTRETKLSITRDTLRAYCAQRKNDDGINIIKVVQEICGKSVKKLSDIPEEQLEEVYEAVKEAE